MTMEWRELLKQHSASAPGVSLVHSSPALIRRDVVNIGLTPGEVDALLTRLTSEDPTVAICLEAIVLCIRPDGTAFFGEVLSRYFDDHVKARRGTIGLARGEVGGTDMDEARVHLANVALPSLVRAELISLPPEGLSAPDSVITVIDRRLRLSLREPARAILARALRRYNAELSVVAERQSRRPLAVEREHDAWAQIWFGVQRPAWSTLALVPAGAGESGFAAAGALVAAGRMYHEGLVELIDACGAEPGSTGDIMSAAADAVARGAQVVIALDSPLTNPASIPIARSAEVALLAVRLGGPRIAEMRRAIDSIGRECFIGSIAVGTAR